MDIVEIQKILEALKTNPILTVVTIFIVVIVAMVTVFMKNYLTEIGKKAASGKKERGEEDTSSGIKIGDIKTHNQSPVIIGNNAAIKYGVPQTVVDRLLKTIEEKDVAIEDREIKLQELTQRYIELDERLADRSPEDEFAAKAKLKLIQGDLEGAEKLSDQQTLKKSTTQKSKKKNRVFLSYAHENLNMVRDIYLGLKKRGLDVWFDKEGLGPGSWMRQIQKAVPKSRYFVICISEAALKKTGEELGFQDEELQQAYEIARVQPEDAFTIIPVRLEDCGRGDHRLSPYQQYDLFNDLETELDRLAVNLGGVSLSDKLIEDTRSEDEKLYDSLHGKAALFFYANDYDKALNLIESALILKPHNTATLLAKGMSLLFLGKEEEASAVFSKIEKIDPQYFAEMAQNKFQSLNLTAPELDTKQTARTK